MKTNEKMKKEWDLAFRVLKAMDETRLIRSAYIWGPPGVGKTWAAYETCSDEEFYAVTLTEETPMSELRGGYMIRDGEQVWGDGPVTMAARHGRRLVLNEISHAGPDAQSFLFPILESDGTCQFTLPTGETVKSAPGFNIVGTDNCSYKDLPEAFQNRWNVKLHITTYSPGGVEGLNDYWREIANFGTMALNDGRLVSLRDFYTLQKLTSEEGGFDRRTACLLVFEEDGEAFENSLAQRDTLIEQKKAEEREAYVKKYGYPPEDAPATPMRSKRGARRKDLSL